MSGIDLVVRGGLVDDGTGAGAHRADVAIGGGRIVAVGTVDPVVDGARVLDAAGLLVTPGFVDIHSHFDANVTWESRLAPSSGHGITATVFGNCGVGFAPCRPADRGFIVDLMEGVEDVPADLLHQALGWTWETYPEYLAAVGARRFDMHVGGLLPHSCLRVYVMGERAIAGEEATPADLAAMSALVSEALDAGAMGVGTTKLWNQKTRAGVRAPSGWAAEAELDAIASALARAGRRPAGGVLQVAPEFNQFPTAVAEIRQLIALAARHGIRVTFTVKQTNRFPQGWRQLLELAAEAQAAGVDIRPQVLGRPTGVVVTWDSTFHRFTRAPSYAAIAGMPLEDRLAELARPGRKSAILAEIAAIEARYPYRTGPELMFPMADVPDYEPTPEMSVAALAASTGADDRALCYELMSDRDGRGAILVCSGNYAEGHLGPAAEMLAFEHSLWGLGDAGAHCTAICDASATTHLLSYWARDRTLGPRIRQTEVIRRLTSVPADFFGLTDRGRLVPGAVADLNVIDVHRLALKGPRMVYDLPGGGRRLVQDAVGYRATIVAGQVVVADDTDTGARPGTLLRPA
ncbi:MAG: amidohydrolase family protein [Acidimicrobiia bacterium]|nr:amidohydrolase family protein [Acidimicrobiia bacterium]MDH4364681.1 amidohydrolase family protein [Acidimicrobiia bacterium]